MNMGIHILGKSQCPRKGTVENGMIQSRPKWEKGRKNEKVISLNKKVDEKSIYFSEPIRHACLWKICIATKWKEKILNKFK